jgi:tetratricopeptide (TPR) repeat protein
MQEMISAVQISPQYIAWLEQAQTLDPANVHLAHDLGLAHYWRALTQSSNRAIEHWERVIANWSLVLDCDDYWRDWCADRAAVYGVPVTGDHIADLKKDLRHSIMDQLAAYDQAHDPSYLRFAFSLESKTIRLLWEADSFPNGSLVAGPLLARQLGADEQVQSFFENRTDAGWDSAAILDYVLSPLQDVQTHPSTAERRSVCHQLRLCFSELGLPAISLEQGYPLQTLELLVALRCPNCESESLDDARHLPVHCHKDCERFARANPSYAGLSDGADLFFRDAMALGVHTCLLVACQHIRDVRINAADIQEYLRRALEFGQALTLVDRLEHEIGLALLAWANSLERDDQRWDEAIELLEVAAEFEDSGQRQGQLAGLLNLRGVRATNEYQEMPSTLGGLRQAAEDFLHAADDLQRACALNPSDTTFRDNLEKVLNALRSFADTARRPDYPLYRRIVDKISQIERRVLAGEVSEAGEGAPVEQLPKPAIMELPILPPDKIYNLDLFDPHGYLIQAVFLDSGWDVLMRTQALSAEQQRTRLRVPALFMALAQSPDGTMGHLLREQGFSPQWLEQQAARYAGARGDTGSDRLRNRTLSQYDFESDMLEILVLAWKIAQYAEKQIGDFHLICGLMLHPSAAHILGHAADQMIATLMSATSLKGL